MRQSAHGLRVALALVAALALAACSRDAPTFDAGDERRIREAHAILDDAARSADWDRSVTVYTDDVVLIPPGSPPIVGRKAARAWMEGAPAVEGSVELVEIDGQRDVAWVAATYELEGTGPDGLPSVTRGSMIEIWREQPDGAWRLARETWNVWAEDGGTAAAGSMAMAEARNEKGIDYVELSTTDMETTKRFYGTLFGWQFTDYGPDYASFNDGRVDGGFAVVEEIVRGGPLIVLYTEDLETLAAAIEPAGGRVSRPIFEFPGGRRFHFTDPAGNELAVWSDR